MEGCLTGFIYFIAPIANQSGVKIGFSKNPGARLADLTSEVGIKLNLIGSIPGTKETEKEIHEKFKDQRLHGEWFRTNQAINRFVSTAIALNRIPADTEIPKRRWGRHGRAPKFRHKLAEMEVGAYRYFANASPDSVKSIASHLGKSYEPNRLYSTQKEKDGVSVWREE